MKTNKLKRKLIFLIHEYDCYYADRTILSEYLNKNISYYPEYHPRYKALIIIKNLIEKLNITSEEYNKIVETEYIRKTKAKKSLQLNNLKETRDNKGVYVGGGGSNRNKIRYPKKVRSKRTWKIFYKMFPNAKKAD